MSQAALPCLHQHMLGVGGSVFTGPLPPVGPVAVGSGLAEPGWQRHLVGLHAPVPAGARSPGVRSLTHSFGVILCF